MISMISIYALDIYDQVINLDVFIELLAQQSNLYSQHDRRNFLTNVEELKTFTGLNYIMPVNPLPSMPMSQDFGHFAGNVGIPDILTRTRYQEVLQQLHFGNNTKLDKNNKGYKIRPIINHLNELFQAVISNQYGQKY